MEFSAKEFVRRFKENYVNFHNLWTRIEKAVPEGIQLCDPKLEPITESKLPSGVRALLEKYRERHPKEKITFIKYMRTINGKPETVVEDERDLPPEEEFLSLSQTLTINTSQFAHVISEIIIARKT